MVGGDDATLCGPESIFREVLRLSLKASTFGLEMRLFPVLESLLMKSWYTYDTSVVEALDRPPPRAGVKPSPIVSLSWLSPKVITSMQGGRVHHIQGDLQLGIFSLQKLSCMPELKTNCSGLKERTKGKTTCRGLGVQTFNL